MPANEGDGRPNAAEGREGLAASNREIAYGRETSQDCNVVMTSMPETNSPSPRTARLVWVATILGSSMAFLDGTVVNLVLPTLQDSFRANVLSVQ